jgi:hypothetical protein
MGQQQLVIAPPNQALRSGKANLHNFGVVMPCVDIYEIFNGTIVDSAGARSVKSRRRVNLGGVSIFDDPASFGESSVILSAIIFKYFGSGNILGLACSSLIARRLSD